MTVILVDDTEREWNFPAGVPRITIPLAERTYAGLDRLLTIPEVRDRVLLIVHSTDAGSLLYGNKYCKSLSEESRNKLWILFYSGDPLKGSGTENVFQSETTCDTSKVYFWHEGVPRMPRVPKIYVDGVTQCYEQICSGHPSPWGTLSLTSYKTLAALLTLCQCYLAVYAISCPQTGTGIIQKAIISMDWKNEDAPKQLQANAKRYLENASDAKWWRDLLDQGKVSIDAEKEWKAAGKGDDWNTLEPLVAFIDSEPEANSVKERVSLTEVVASAYCGLIKKLSGAF